MHSVFTHKSLKCQCSNSHATSNLGFPKGNVFAVVIFPLSYMADVAGFADRPQVFALHVPKDGRDLHFHCLGLLGVILRGLQPAGMHFNFAQYTIESITGSLWLVTPTPWRSVGLPFGAVVLCQ